MNSDQPEPRQLLRFRIVFIGMGLAFWWLAFVTSRDSGGTDYSAAVRALVFGTLLGIMTGLAFGYHARHVKSRASAFWRDRSPIFWVGASSAIAGAVAALGFSAVVGFEAFGAGYFVAFGASASPPRSSTKEDTSPPPRPD